MFPVTILAGGLATRLRPLTESIPKALVSVSGEPFVAHQLRLLKANGINRIVVCAGHLGEMIQEFVGDGVRFGLKVEFSFEGEHLLGTAGAIKKALPLLGDAFYVLYGDAYLPCDYRAVQAAFENCGQLALMTVFHNDGRWDTSNVDFADGRILAHDKRNPTPRMSYIDYGLGVFNRAAFQYVPEGQPYDLATLYQRLLKEGQLGAYEVSKRFYEIGSFESLEELDSFLRKQAYEG